MSIALTLKIISFNLICVYHIFVDNIEVGIVLKKLKMSLYVGLSDIRVAE